MTELSEKETMLQVARPRVSIGLPVYNGENYLAEAIESILDQTYTDFELVISDNASTDRTEEICRTFAEQDARVHYFRHERNRGASPNYNFTFEKARGEYFKWAAHDDVLHPRFLEETVKALDANPEASLAYSKTRKIDANGELAGTYDRWDGRLRVAAHRPSLRFGDMICVPHNCLAIFGLMRTDQLARTNLHAAFQGADRALLAEMALRGPIHQVPEYLFDRREHPGAYTAKQKGGIRLGWWDAEQAGKVTFPNWRRIQEYVMAIRRVNPQGNERVLAYAQLLRWLAGPYWYRQRWLRLVGDVIRGVWLGFMRLSRRPVRTRA